MTTAASCKTASIDLSNTFVRAVAMFVLLVCRNCPHTTNGGASNATSALHDRLQADADSATLVFGGLNDWKTLQWPEVAVPEAPRQHLHLGTVSSHK